MVSGESEGVVSSDNKVIGTYVHGIFDHTEARESLLKWAGTTEVSTIDFSELSEQGIDLMADTLEEYLDVDKIESIIKRDY